MAITTTEARQRILDDLANALDQVALALECLGEAYELLPTGSADRLESELFPSVQKALGRGKRTYSGFADRVSLTTRRIEGPPPGPSTDGARALVTQAVACASDGDRRIAELQDTMLPVEAGDGELRSGLGETRELLSPLAQSAGLFLRALGR